MHPTCLESNHSSEGPKPKAQCETAEEIKRAGLRLLLDFFLKCLKLALYLDRKEHFIY